MSINATLPTPKEGNTAGEGTGANADVGAGSVAVAGAAASAAASNSQSADNSNSVGQAGANQAAKQGSLNKLMHVQAQADNEATSDISQGVSAPQTAPYNPRPAKASPGIWGDVTHLAGQVNQFLNPVQQITHPAQTWHNLSNMFDQVGSQAAPIAPGIVRTPNTGGGRQSVDSNVTEPTNVWNPSTSSSAYTSPTSVSGGNGARAIEMSPYSPQFKASFGREAARVGQAASQAADQPSNSDIWDELGSWAKDIAGDPVEIG